MHGEGVSQNHEEAVKWYQKSAEQGNARAQNYLGMMYEIGAGVSQNYKEAVKWYRKSAEQGDAVGQYFLGMIYENGNGVSQNYEEAVKWFRKSAEQGNEYAQNNLGRIYENGKGVSQDYEEAAKWYTAAIENNIDEAYTYMARGRIYLKQLNQPKLAEKDFLKVLSLENEIQEDKNYSQYVLFFLGKTDEAIAYQNSILSKYPAPGNYYDAACLYSLMNRQTKAIALLRTSFEKGFNDFENIDKNTDLDNIRNVPEFINLIKEWKNKE
jgi:TPR repeat protein